MAGIGENVATHVAESLADKAMRELKYFCCYKRYVDDFEDKKKHLKASAETIRKNIEEAHNRNENLIESDVKLWREEADRLIEEDTKGKEKWFGLVTNCFWQYNRGKDLEDKKQRIQQLVEQGKNFTRVGRSTGLPGIGFYSIENFMQLKHRKLPFGQLTEALKNDKKFVIGLYGLGGTGKTTMAIEVGIKVAESKVFDKVIFSVVSKNPNLKNIRDNIAKHLNLGFKEGTDESEQAQELWKRIAECGQKVLLILDDVWEKLSLLDIGIPLGRHGKSCCSMLLTTRDRRVCSDMRCPEPIELEVLSVEDAVDLFLSYAGQSIDDSSNDFKDVALDIVKECGRLPVAIVAVARALNSRPLIEWKQALERLRNPKSIHDVNEDLKEAYNSLRLSYDYLENKEAKQLFLVGSLFPDDYEISIELLTRIAIGMGLCGGANKYSVARSYFTPIKNVLMDSCLLLKAENEAVKMHDLVREVALWIGNKLVQVVMDSSTTLMENIQYSSWNINDFPSHFDGRKLEVLLLWISNKADSTTVKVPNGIFEGMENLKILALMNWSHIRISDASLFQSHPSLINVRSLAIKGFELGDISFMVNLKSLESLELSNCSMIELPKEIRELEKLRLLEMVKCDIKRNDPFEVIGSCLQLEELYFVSNNMYMDEDTCESLAQITTFPQLERYRISALRDSKVDFSISGYFDSEFLGVNFSDEIFIPLVARAEVLGLDGGDGLYDNKGWTNVVPDILSVKDDIMEDHLINLCLQSINEIKCLIRTQHLRFGVAIFSKLIKLVLMNMDVRELCCGPYPVNFLKQLEELFLSGCENLEGSLFDGKLELCNLKSIRLYACSITCLFCPSTAGSLKQLEMLDILECYGLKYIVAEPMEDHDPNQKSHDSMFPKLNYLSVRFCPKLEFILPICFCKELPLLESMKIINCEKLEYIFGQYPDERDLHQMGKEAVLQSLKELIIERVPNFIDLYAECDLPYPGSDEAQKSSPSTNVEDCTSTSSRGRLCCFRPKSNASTIYHPSTSTNHNEAMKVNYVVNRAQGLFTPPLYPYTLLRRLEISGLVGLKSLFTLSIASSLQLLEILTVGACDTLEHLVTDKEDDHDHNSIFPNLTEVKVYSCSDLEYLFSISSGKLPRLLYVDIRDTPKLGEVFRWKHGEGQKLVMEDVFPKLCVIRLESLPTLHTICQGIDFHTVKSRRVRECPAISLTSTELNKLPQSSVHEDEDASYVRMISGTWFLEDFDEQRWGWNFGREGYTEHKQNRISPNLLENEEVSKEIVEEDATTNSNLPNLTKSTKTSANEIVEEKLSTNPSSDLNMNLKATFGEGPSEKYGKASSSMFREKESMDNDQQAHGESRSSNEPPQRIEEPTKEWSSKETSNEVSLKIQPPSVTEMTSALSSSISSPKKPQIATSTSHVEMESWSSQSDLLTISAIPDESLQERIMNQPESSTAKQGKFDQGSLQQFAEDDLLKLFQIMEEGAEMEVHMPHVSKIAAVHDDNELIKALTDLEGSLKMSLNEIASSKESRFRLENALNILSSHCSEHGAPYHGLQTTIHTLQQEIQNVLSSSKQAYATIGTYNMLEHKEKLFTEERSKRKEAAVALLSEICNKESSLAEASLKEAEMKEKISKLQAELDRKEKQIQEYEMELISLKEQKKKSVYDTMGFIKEFEAVKKEKSHMVEKNMNAKEHLQIMDVKWSSCLSNLKKTIHAFRSSSSTETLTIRA